MPLEIGLTHAHKCSIVGCGASSVMHKVNMAPTGKLSCIDLEVLLHCANEMTWLLRCSICLMGMTTAPACIWTACQAVLISLLAQLRWSLLPQHKTLQA